MGGDDSYDWAGKHRRALRISAWVAGVIGVAMNFVHEAGQRSIVSTVIGIGFLAYAVWAWTAPSRIPRPPRLPEPWNKDE
jgi:hypothetical protein